MSVLYDLSRKGIRSAQTLIEQADLTLAEYLDRIKKPPANSRRNPLTRALRRCHLPDETARAIVEMGVIQTADSCQSVLDRETLANNVIYDLWAERHGVRDLLTQQCSTVRLLMGRHPPCGPGLLTEGEEVINVFDLSRKKLASTNVATSGSIRFSSEMLRQLPAGLDIQFVSAAQAFLCANAKVWQHMFPGSNARLAFVDEDLSSFALAESLMEPNSPLSNLFHDPHLVQALIHHVRAAVERGECLVLRATTDLFYLRADQRLVPCRFLGQSFVDSTGKIKIELADLKDALNENRIYPALLPAFLAISIWPRIKCFGGASQHQYYVEILRLMEQFDREFRIFPDHYFDAFLADEYTPLLSSLLNDQPALGRIAHRRDQRERWLNTPLRELVGDGSYLNYFQHLLQRRDQLGTFN